MLGLHPLSVLSLLLIGCFPDPNEVGNLPLEPRSDASSEGCMKSQRCASERDAGTHEGLNDSGALLSDAAGEPWTLDATVCAARDGAVDLPFDAGEDDGWHFYPFDAGEDEGGWIFDGGNWPPDPDPVSHEGFNKQTCTFNGKKLYGHIQEVTSFADVKVKVVSSFADLHVKLVDSFPDSCGKWQMVTSFADTKVQFVSSFADLDIEYVDSFPGVD